MAIYTKNFQQFSSTFFSCNSYNFKPITQRTFSRFDSQLLLGRKDLYLKRVKVKKYSIFNFTPLLISARCYSGIKKTSRKKERYDKLVSWGCEKADCLLVHSLSMDRSIWDSSCVSLPKLRYTNAGLRKFIILQFTNVFCVLLAVFCYVTEIQRLTIASQDLICWKPSLREMGEKRAGRLSKKCAPLSLATIEQWVKNVGLSLAQEVPHIRQCRRPKCWSSMVDF